MRATKNKKTGRYQLRFYDSAGKRQQFSSAKDFPAGTKQKEADKIATAIYEIHETVLTKVSRPLLSDCVDRTIQHLKNIGVKGLKVYESHAKMALTYCCKDDTIDDVVRVCISMRDDMLAAIKPNGSPKYSGNTVGKRMNIYKRTANLAFQEWDIVEQPLSQKMKPPKKPKARTRFLTPQECGNLVDLCQDDQTRYILALYALTGIRHAELTRMQSSYILKNRITIDGKNGTVRSFAISAEALDVASKIEFPITRTYDQLYKHFCDAKDLAGVEDFGMHDLRHTFASWLAQSGDVSLHHLQQVLGHSQMNQTLKYAHLMPENLDSVATSLSIESK